MIKLSIHFTFSLFGRNRQTRKSKGKLDFCQAALNSIESLVGIRAKSTIDNYQTALRSFSSYTKRPLAIEDISPQLMEGYQRWLTEKGISLNTISCYMRSLRSLINKIQPEADSQRLFNNVFTGKERTEKRSLSIEDVSRLRQLTLPSQSSLSFARDLFLFSFYALGMPFVDIAHLRETQIKNGYIDYRRHKTGQRVCVKLEPPMLRIINRYHVAGSPYVFPILNDGDGMGMGKGYEAGRARYNHHLRHLGKLANVQRKLTSYVARHTWASTAYHSNVSLPVISKALGHSSPNTTQVYLQAIDDHSIEAANRMLIAHLMRV